MTERRRSTVIPGHAPVRSGDDRRPLGSLESVISAAQIERNAWAVDDYNPWYMDDSPFGGRIITPVFLASFDATLFYAYYAYPPSGSLLASRCSSTSSR